MPPGLNTAEGTEASVYGYYRAGNETCRITAKELYESVKFGYIAEPFHGCPGNDLFASFGVIAIRVNENGPVLVAQKKAGGNRVDPDLFVEFQCQLGSQPLGEDFHSVLRHRITRHPCET